jgi:hypothetical protein
MYQPQLFDEPMAEKSGKELELDHWAWDVLVPAMQFEVGHSLETNYDVGLSSPTSRYRVSSALQKCIRRGWADKAVFYAQALYNGGQAAYLWNRLPIIAMEDMGPGNWELCARVLHFCRFSSVRETVGPKSGLSWLVRQMAGSLKSRSLTEAYCSVSASPATDDPGILNRASYMVGLGWYRDPGVFNPFKHLTKTKDRQVVLEEICQMVDDPAIQYTFSASCKKSVDHLHALMPEIVGYGPGHPVVSTPCPYPQEFKGVPEIAIDKHTSEGSRALKALVIHSKVLPKWVDDQKLRIMVFITESAVLDKQIDGPVFRGLRRKAERLETAARDLTAEQEQELRQLLVSPEFQKELRQARASACGAK